MISRPYLDNVSPTLFLKVVKPSWRVGSDAYRPDFRRFPIQYESENLVDLQEKSISISISINLFVRVEENDCFAN